MWDEPRFLAIYEGRTISTARIIGATADPSLVQFVADRVGMQTPGSAVDVKSQPSDQTVDKRGALDCRL